MQKSIKQNIREKAFSLGFDLAGFAKCETLDEDAEFSSELARKGYFADLDYLERNLPVKRNPQLLLPNAKSVIVAAKNYYRPIVHPHEKLKIARYALLPDYHTQYRSALNDLCEFLETEFHANTFASLDGGRVFEKLWAERAGLGFRGRHSLLITPQYGSFVHLAVIFCDIEIQPDIPGKSLCGNCTKCVSACPNSAISAGGGVDLRKCISYHTIENKGEIPPEITLAGNVYGCDICQEACPQNQKILSANSEKAVESGIMREEVFAMTPEIFNKIYSDSPIKRIKYHRFRRNAEKC